MLAALLNSVGGNGKLTVLLNFFAGCFGVFLFFLFSVILGI